MARPPTLLLSIDFEDWHQLVYRRLGLPNWDRPHEALELQTTFLLDLLDEVSAKATFFLLGMSADKHPELVKEIARRGHEPASHGYAHRLVYNQSPNEFATDVAQASDTISGLTGRAPVAYRAPAFSINRRTPWAYDILAELGFRYDSSQYDSPRVPDRLRAIPEGPYRITLESSEIWELPVATRGRLPIGGGSYWRLLPPRLIEAGLRECAVLYFHPYEFGPPLRAELPLGSTARQRLTAAQRRLWRNAGRTIVAKRLRRVARTHRLVSYDQAYDDIHRLYGTRTRALSPEGVLV